jgi:hypothetical protein
MRKREELMFNNHHTYYQGYRITTRCCETGPGSFQASYSVVPPLGGSDCWQRFPGTISKTAHAATAHAFHAAKQSIEADVRKPDPATA